MSILLNTLGCILIQWNNTDQFRNDTDSNQGPEMMTIKMFAVIKDWLIKNQNEYNELHSVTTNIGLGKLWYYGFGVQSLESPDTYFRSYTYYMRLTYH